MRRRATELASLGLATGALGFALDQAGLPSSYLFAALLVGLAAAITLPGLAGIPAWVFRASQAVVGVVLGSQVRSSSLTALAHAWLPVTLVSVGTLVLSLAAGKVLARVTFVDAPTGALGMVAGGASGIVAMADELGADGRLVAFMQYLRVLVVVLLTPLLIPLLFPGHHGGSVPGQSTFGDLKGWLLTIGVAVVGSFVAQRLKLTAGMLLAPMLLAAAVVLAVPGGEFNVPQVLQQVAFAGIGLQVGLRFTMETLRSLGNLLVPALAMILLLIVSCFGLAVLLDKTTSVSLLDAYLATTPGGLFAVVAVAFGAGANSTFILGVQGLRIIVMVLLAPVAVRWLTRGSVKVG
ncbi:MAG TPA: AbrB family transcriptional regulator [Thermoleophilaceae bacterium]|nr:AbrB family transcriptional regulator [Thermoleophilaceae bacterium]